MLLAAGNLDGMTVLDLGCGSGFFSRAFADAGAQHVLCIDCSAKQISIARRIPSSPVVDYDVGDVLSYNYPMADIVCAPFFAELHER